MYLKINNVTKSYLDKIVLDNASLTLSQAEVVGLVGNNGCGKTTLLKLIAGHESPENGQVSLSANTLLRYIPQTPEYDPDTHVGQLLAEEFNLDASQVYQIDVALHQIDIAHLADKHFGRLSSGQKTKVYLARLIIGDPDILLLDEPTNHLDIEALEWFENYLRQFSGLALMVTHDRRLLDNLATRIIELNQGQLTEYGGNYSFYKQQKQIQKEAYQRQFQEQQNKIKKMEATIQSKQSQAQSIESETINFHYRKRALKVARKGVVVRRKMERLLESEDHLEKPEFQPKLNLKIKPNEVGSQNVVHLKGVIAGYSDHTVLDQLNLLVEQNDRLALLGPNGSGKSTLIKLLIDELKPMSGEINWGNHIKLGYLPQETHLIKSDLNLIEFLIQNSGADRTKSHTMAKHFLFTDNDLNIPVSQFSSGQQSKLKLAQIMLEGANFLVLDEPTNHLDIKAREGLEVALRNYSGTIVVASHDRYFLEEIGITKQLTLASPKSGEALVD